MARKKGRLKSRRRERSSRGRTPPTRIGATSCDMHRNPMPFGRERWHRPPRFAHADSLRIYGRRVQRGCEVHQVLQHIAADRLQLDLSRPSTPVWRASTEEVCASAWCAPRHLTSQASTRALDLCSTASSLSRTFLPPVAGGRGGKSLPAPARWLMLLPRCEIPRPPSPLVAP